MCEERQTHSDRTLPGLTNPIRSTTVSYTHLMSRMGRDYLKVGQIMEILRQRGVRLIAINDGVDLSLIHISKRENKIF